MLVTVALGGLALLLFLAVVVGYTDGRAQGQAWRRIAAERHRIWLDRQRNLEVLEQHECRCPDCPHC